MYSEIVIIFKWNRVLANPQSRIQVEWVEGYFVPTWPTSARLYGDHRGETRDLRLHRRMEPGRRPAAATPLLTGGGTRSRRRRLGRFLLHWSKIVAQGRMSTSNFCTCYSANVRASLHCLDGWIMDASAGLSLEHTNAEKGWMVHLEFSKSLGRKNKAGIYL
jgi:hypothetical protein